MSFSNQAFRHQEVRALRRIASGEPDTKLPEDLNEPIKRLERLGLIQICGCSDGDYVILTKLGKWAIGVEQ